MLIPNHKKNRQYMSVFQSTLPIIDSSGLVTEIEGTGEKK